MQARPVATPGKCRADRIVISRDIERNTVNRMSYRDSYSCSEKLDVFQNRRRIGIIAALYKDDGTVPDSCSASVLHNQVSLNEQLKTDLIGTIDPDRVFAYPSEEAALTSSAFYFGDWWDEGYYPDDMCEDRGIKPLYRRYLWVVSIDTIDGVPHAQATRLDTHHAINIQLEEQHLRNAYLCKSKSEAERLAAIINANSYDIKTRR